MISNTFRPLLYRKPKISCLFFMLLLWFLTSLSSPAQVPAEDHLRITLSAPNIYTLNVATNSLWEYQMEASNDLEIWQPLDSIFLPGDGGVHAQRVVVPQGAVKAFFRYRMQERAGGVSGDTLTDWDRIYSFNADTFLDSDHDGIPDYLETALGTDAYDGFSFPWQVVRVSPLDQLAGHPRDGAIVVYLNRPLPASVVSVPANFVRRLYHDVQDILDFANLAPGSAMILPGRKAVAFLPSPALAAGSNHTYVNNYKIDFTTAVTGIAQLVPWHSEFSTVDIFDEVGSWVTKVRPGETAIEVAKDFAPVIDWSQPLHPSTLVSGNASVVEQVSGMPIAATVSFDYDTNRMTLQHAAPFQSDTTYTVTLGTGFTNLMGKPLLNAFTWSFRTRPVRPAPVAGQGPFVTTIGPVDFSTNVNATNLSQITLNFSEPMDNSTLNASTIHVREHGSEDNLAAYFDYDAATRTLSIPVGLSGNTRYELSLDAAAIFSAANPPQPLQGQTEFVFMTADDTIGGGGGGGTNANGTAGTPDPDAPEPLVLGLSYGDPEPGGFPDAGASVKLTVTLPDGSGRSQQMPNATNEYPYRQSSEIPAGSTVEITPYFLKGNDPDYDEELEEVQVELIPTSFQTGGYEYLVFKQSDTASASSAVWELLGPLSAGPFVAKVKNKEKLKVAPAVIVPDDNMVGVIGDVIPSAMAGSTIQHFVTPKKTTALSQEFVNLKVNIAAAEFAQFYEWEGGVAGSAANKRKVSRTATGTGPTVVKLKTKKEGAVVSEMRVWVVWADVVASLGEQTFHPNDGIQSSYETTNDFDKGWRFIFQIKPAAICDGSIPDYPDLKGASKKAVPGAKVQHPAVNAPPFVPADTAEFKWDVSRQFKITIKNPGLIPKNELRKVFGDVLTANQPKAADDVALSFPGNYAEGNDDTTGHSNSEDVDPYHSYATGLKHQVAELSSFDSPFYHALNTWGAAGRDFSIETNFREFARVELWDGKRKGGEFWFQVSDFSGDALWFIYFNVTWDAATSSWLNAFSTSSKGNPHP